MIHRLAFNTQPSAPTSLIALSQCGTGSDGLQTIGCLASGFFPAESLNFKWTDGNGNALTDFVQYPATSQSSSALKISHITVSQEQWKQRKKIMCKAENPKGHLSKEFKKPVDQQAPVLSLVPVITKKSSYVMCVVEDFFPKDLTVQWKVNDKTETSETFQQNIPDKNNGLYTTRSYIKLRSDTNTVYTCQVTHQGKTIREKKNFNAKFTLTLKPPVQREIFVNNKIILEAVVSGSVIKAVEDASVSCLVDNQQISGIPGKTKFLKEISQHNRIYSVTVDHKKWFEGKKVICSTRDTNGKEIREEIQFNKGDGKKPNVVIYRPDNDKPGHVSLVCEVASAQLGDVYIMWIVGAEKKYIEAPTSGPIRQETFTSVLSFLTVTPEQYKNSEISCAVQHANINHIISPLIVSTSKTKFTLTLKPPVQREIFVNNKIILEAVVSGSVIKAVEDASVSCLVDNQQISGIPGNTKFLKEISQHNRIYSVTVDHKKWFEGKKVICSTRDTNGKEIREEIQFNKGDGKKPNVVIYRPDNDKPGHVSLVCEVASAQLGDVYIMWIVGAEKKYIEAPTSGPIRQETFTSVLSFLTVTPEQYKNSEISCAVQHANINHTISPLIVSTSKTMFTLTLKPPVQREIFVNNKIILEAVVSGSVIKAVEDASVSCLVDNQQISGIPGNTKFLKEISQHNRIYSVTVDHKKWFEGKKVICSTRDTNGKEIREEIQFNKGDGKKPNVVIYRPDNDKPGHVSLVCEVASAQLGDVYIMWIVGAEKKYIEAPTSGPIHQETFTSVLSFLTVTPEQYKNSEISCAVQHANINHTISPLIVSTSKSMFTLTLKPPVQREIFVNNKIILEAVVSGSVIKAVEDASVSCLVDNQQISGIPGNTKFLKEISQHNRIYSVTVDHKKWFEGKKVICSTRDTNGKEIREEIQFNKGDGKKPNVVIYRPDNDKPGHVSLVCEVASAQLGDVYIMWIVGAEKKYIEAPTSGPIHQETFTSVLSFLTVTPEQYKNSEISCAVQHANINHTISPLIVSTSKTNITLTLKPPVQREILVNNKIILEAVVSGSVIKEVEDASVSCLVDNQQISGIPGNTHFLKEISQYNRIYNFTVDHKKWFEGKKVICSTRDTNGKEIRKEIQFNKGDGKKPNVVIYRPDNDKPGHVSLVCEVTSTQLGDVYIMWTVGAEKQYIEAPTSGPIRQETFTSVLSFLTVTPEQYKNSEISCAVQHANINNTISPLIVSTSKSEPPEPETGFALLCNKNVLEEDEFRSLWYTATSFIFLFFFTLTYSALLSFFKKKRKTQGFDKDVTIFDSKSQESGSTLEPCNLSSEVVSAEDEYLHAISNTISVIDPQRGTDEMEEAREACYRFGNPKGSVTVMNTSTTGEKEPKSQFPQLFIWSMFFGQFFPNCQILWVRMMKGICHVEPSSYFMYNILEYSCQCDNAFDYWGKGTMVTVSSAQTTAPHSLLAMSQCGSDSDGFLTVGCIAKGFSPADSLTFEWTDPDGKKINDFVKYPATGQDGAYASISHMRLKKSDWEAKKGYTCTAGNSAKKLKASPAPPTPPPDQRASVYLTAPTKMELDNGTATFICFAKQFSPKTHLFKWFQDGEEVKNGVTDKCLGEKKSNITEYSATSIFQISANKWKNLNTKIMCVFEHKAGNEVREAEYTVTDIEDVRINIDIIPPSTEDMLKNKAGNLMCKVTGEELGFTKMEIRTKASENPIKEHTEEQIKNNKTLDLVARIGYDEWSIGTEFWCIVEHKKLAVPQEKKYSRENGGELKRPSVYILAPPEHREGETMTLTCYVKDFYPKEVFVSWLANDEPVGGGYKQNTTTPMQINNHFSIYSQLTFDSSNWKEGTVYSCVVYHESIDQTLRVLTRSIDSNTDKSSIINVSLDTAVPCKA
ncbi:uncharacterized protein LOC127451543 [Myxocyprinus asiaticus]|uniref:uncharacterized protein LOC127451543 n=1 Tax=Myxocyprinus asiaticus TaxID=70543 RepID=UPI002223CDEB|nr:uncharacterized protein LOC127451543 [Myxocyprinus asiaticus]